MQTIVYFILFGILFGVLIYEFWGNNKKYAATKFIWTKPTSTETINLCEESGYLSISGYKSELGNLIKTNKLKDETYIEHYRSCCKSHDQYKRNDNIMKPRR